MMLAILWKYLAVFPRQSHSWEFCCLLHSLREQPSFSRHSGAKKDGCSRRLAEHLLAWNLQNSHAFFSVTQFRAISYITYRRENIGSLVCMLSLGPVVFQPCCVVFQTIIPNKNWNDFVSMITFYSPLKQRERSSLLQWLLIYHRCFFSTWDGRILT